MAWTPKIWCRKMVFSGTFDCPICTKFGMVIAEMVLDVTLKGIVDILFSFSTTDQNMWAIIGIFDPFEVNTVNSGVFSFSYPVDLCTRMSIRGVDLIFYVLNCSLVEVKCCRIVPNSSGYRHQISVMKYITHYTIMSPNSSQLYVWNIELNTQHSLLMYSLL